MKQQIGFIGLGTMGKPMALNLLKAGYDIRVFNRTALKMDSLIREGAIAATSYKDAAFGCDVVITMLSDSPVVKEAVIGENGTIHSANTGTIIIDMSTISPTVTKEIASECEKHGVIFLDAPVSGGESGAIAGTLSIMIGGDKDALERVKPIFEVLGSKVTYMGESGNGQSAKLCNQVICGLNILAACEGLALGVASGLDLEALLSAISGGAAGSWMLSNLAPKMLVEDWNPGFRIALQQKDLRLALESASENYLPLLGTALASQLFRASEANGYGDEGTQSLFKIIKSLGSL